MASDELWPTFLSRLPERTFSAAAVLILVGLATSIWWFTLAAKRLSQSMGREDRLLHLHEELTKARGDKQTSKETASHFILATSSARRHLDILNQIRHLNLDKLGIGEVQDQLNQLIQRTVESIATDFKHIPGEQHRCGVWIEDRGELALTFASSGFPAYYLAGGRRLNINQSVAGSAFRRIQTIKRDD